MGVGLLIDPQLLVSMLELNAMSNREACLFRVSEEGAVKAHLMGTVLSPWETSTLGTSA